MGRKVIARSASRSPSTVIGITGSFCSGKSTVALVFKQLGARVFDCDRVAHNALSKKSPIYKTVIRTFGRSILTRSGSIDRNKLGAIVFSNKGKRKKLEGLIHPYVLREMKRFIKTHTGIRVIEVPLLFEARLEKLFDMIIVVACNQKNSIARARNKYPLLTVAEIKQRIASQMPLQEKKRRADFIIDNTDLKTAIQKTRVIWNRL